MKNYTIYLIRHGITEGNLEGKYIGLTDLPLCDEGYYAITRYAHDRLYPDVQKVYSSPLKRCLETADIIYPDRYVKQIDNIAECDFGEFEGKTAEELQDLPEYAEWLKGGYEAAAPGGESFGDFTLRCLDGLEEIFKDMMHDQVTKAAVITHGGVIMNLCAGYGLPKGKP
ncbi:MAG: histidine phosphatase family protein, partial [Ruminiclostridium sp.]